MAGSLKKGKSLIWIHGTLRSRKIHSNLTSISLHVSKVIQTPETSRIHGIGCRRKFLRHIFSICFPHLPVPYIFGTRGRSLPDILATGRLVPNIQNHIENWKIRFCYRLALFPPPRNSHHPKIVVKLDHFRK